MLSSGRIQSAISAVYRFGSKKYGFGDHQNPDRTAIDINARGLPSLRSYSTRYFSVQHDFNEGPADVDPFLRVFDHVDPQSNSVSITFCANEPVKRRGDCDVMLTAGYRAPSLPEPNGYYLLVQVGGRSPGWKDVAIREQLYRRIFQVIEVDPIVEVSHRNERFYLSAQHPWAIKREMAYEDGGNPAGFYLFGFPNLNDVRRRTDRLLTDIFTEIVELSVCETLTPSAYESIRHALAALADDWNVQFLGDMTPEAREVLAGKPVHGYTDVRIPICDWLETLSRREAYRVDWSIDCLETGFALVCVTKCEKAEIVTPLFELLDSVADGEVLECAPCKKETKYS